MSRRIVAMLLLVLLGACADYGRSPVDYASTAAAGMPGDTSPAGPRATFWRSSTGVYPLSSPFGD